MHSISRNLRFLTRNLRYHFTPFNGTTNGGHTNSEKILILVRNSGSTMIQKIKDLMKIKELVDSVNETVSKQNETVEQLNSKVSSLNSDIECVKNEFSAFKQESGELVLSLKNAVQEIKQTKQDFVAEMNDFKLQRTQMQKKMLERADGELGEHMERLRSDVSRYNDLKTQIDSINSQLNGVQAEIGKFVTISSRIKEKDFELVSFAKQLKSLDDEKLELMRKIDTLERLVSKQRRMMN